MLLPCAGNGSRFTSAGYTFPKPLIPAKDGKPMIECVVENLGFKARYIFIVRKEHNQKYNLDLMLKQIAGPETVVIEVDKLTEGAACTALLAKQYINNDDELIIANSDQIVEFSRQNFDTIREWTAYEGLIFVFNATHPKWSFAKLHPVSKHVVEVAEKRPISNVATCGIYVFKHGADFVYGAEEMMRKNIRTNNEFYIAPVFNELIEQNKLVLPFFVDKMWGIGTPEDLSQYLNQEK